MLSLRTAQLAGLDDTQVRDMLAGNARRIADGEEPKQPSKPVGSDTFSQPMVFARIHQYLSMATPLLWTRQADNVGVLGLALNATGDRNGRPEELDRIRELIATAQTLWSESQQIEDEAERWSTNRVTFRLIHLADILAVTTP